MFRRILSALPVLSLVLLTSPAAAECVGQNLIAALAPDQLATITRAANVPFARGNLWTATKGAQTITLIGTYHLDDPRHAATLAVVATAVTQAATLLVEAGPEEEAALMAYLSSHPERLLSTGPTLPEAMDDAHWLRLSDALRARGVPPFFAAKLQPWYVTSLLAIPACQFAGAAAHNGLDRRLIGLATANSIPVKSLEPYDTIFTIFDSFTPADQMTMLLQTLDAGALGDDMAVTLADSYFAGESRLFWEFSRLQLMTLSGATQAEADRQLALVETALITRRNRAWVPVITDAATKGPLVVAFGALHLSGDQGVLNLLVQDGWSVASVPP